MQGMETINLTIGVLALLTGLLLVIAPTALIRAGEFFNRVYNLESLVYKQRVPFGIVFIIAGTLLLLIVW